MKLPKSLQSAGARVAAMAAALIVIGCVLLSVLDGWVGVLVWVVAAPLVCVAIDVAFRNDAKPRKPERPRTALVLRVTRRSASSSRRRAEPPRFVWHSQGRSPRRSR